MELKSGLTEASDQTQYSTPARQTTAQASALVEYRQALDTVDEEARKAGFVDAVLNALRCRDRVALEMEADQVLVGQWLPELLPLDGRLKDKASVIVEKVGTDTLVQWRDTVQAQAMAWWWFLDQKADSAEQVRHGVLLLFAGLFITFSLTLAGDICTRFLSGGPDKWGIIVTAAQGFLAFLAGSAFLAAGRQWLVNFYSRVRLPRRVQSLASFLVALVTMLCILGFRLSLPRISEKYYDHGRALRQKNDISLAMESYRRSIALDPDNMLAHFGLGNAYKSVLDYDKAIAEYQRVIELDSSHAGANNQLMLCFLLKGNDYDRALEIISRIFPVDGKDADTRYAAYKNRAWALWGLKRYKLADADLHRALEARPDGAEAHAILAQVLEDEGKKTEAFPHWQKAANLADGDYISARWLSLAIERVMEGRK